MPAQSEQPAAEARVRPPWQVVVVAVILALEALAMAGVGVWMVVIAFGESGMQIAGTLFLAALALGSAVWLAFAAKGLLQRRAWTRAATIVWQILQIAGAVAVFGGDEPRMDLAVAFVLPAVAAGILVLQPAVSRWLPRER